MSLMFEKNDVEAAGPFLVRLLRLLFYRGKITLDQFGTLCGEHGRKLGSTPAMVNTHRNNLRKTLAKDDDMTWRFFQYVLLNIMRINIVEIRLVIKNEKGELIEIGSSDPPDDLPKIISASKQPPSV